MFQSPTGLAGSVLKMPEFARGATSDSKSASSKLDRLVAQVWLLKQAPPPWR